jgi:hypothetical protein
MPRQRDVLGRYDGKTISRGEKRVGIYCVGVRQPAAHGTEILTFCKDKVDCEKDQITLHS